MTPTAQRGIPALHAYRSMMKRPRDSQKSKLYKSEHVFTESELRQFSTVPEMQEYVDDLVTQSWFEQKYGFLGVLIRPGYGARHAFARPWEGTITVPRRYREELTLLHETAHIVQPELTAWHGPEFCTIFAELVFRRMGRQAEKLLLASFDLHRVKYAA